LRQGANPDYSHGTSRDGRRKRRKKKLTCHDFPSTLPQEN